VIARKLILKPIR